MIRRVWHGAPAAVVLLLVSACVTPPRMCLSEGDCGAQASCVAGRCVAHGATPAIDTARRLLFFPVDVAYLRSDADARDAAAATLGGVRDRGAIVLLRFSAPVAPDVNVLEAYLVLERATDVDADPTLVLLRAARIVDPWDGRSVSWARQPRVEEVGAPVTRVSPAAGALVRLDVRALVHRWRRRSGNDFGVAVVAEGQGLTGMAFALVPAVGGPYEPILAPIAPAATQAPSPFEPHPAPPSSVAEPRRQLIGPRLEFYVK
jgi:hypothetical protein